jgi:NADH-quinone oxidoreductase subunit I
MAYFIDRDEKLPLLTRLWLPGILRGMCVTAKHFFKNLLHPNRRMTVEYPEQKKPIPPGYRAEHRLMQREDGSIRCTACMLCAAACPAGCIEIEAEEVADPRIEKRAKRFVIDELRCVFCGLCVEVCPCDAIRMDTGKYDRVGHSREDLVLGMEVLTDPAQGGGSPLSRAL